jgi:integrase
MRVTTLSLDSIDLFRKWYSDNGKSENTLKGYTSDLREFLRAVDPSMSPIQMEEYEDLAQSWIEMNRKKVSLKTTQRRLTSLRSFGVWSGLESPLKELPPSANTSLPVNHAVPLVDGRKGILRIIGVAANREEQAIVTFCGLMGFRISEALAVTVQDFSIPRMTVMQLPMERDVWEFLMEAYAAAFSDPRGRLITYNDRSARQIITDLATKAGIQRRVTSSDLRATWKLFNEKAEMDGPEAPA